MLSETKNQLTKNLKNMNIDEGNIVEEEKDKVGGLLDENNNE